MQYICTKCKSRAIRVDGTDIHHPDDYLLICTECGNWEQAGFQEPCSFVTAVTAKEE